LLSTVPSPALGPKQLSTKWVRRAQEPGREDDHSFLVNTEIKNVWSYTSSPPYVSRTLPSAVEYNEKKRR